MNYTGYYVNNLSFEDKMNYTKAGDLIKKGNDGIVVKAAVNDAFLGIVTSKRGTMLSVQLFGYMELPYTGATPGYGPRRVLSDGNNGLIFGENGRECLVVKVDTASGTVGIILT